MAKENEGIMGLEAGMQAPQMEAGVEVPALSPEDSYDAVTKGLVNARPDVALDYRAAMDEIVPNLDELTDEQLDVLIMLFQALFEDKKNYKKNVAELVSRGLLDEGDLPEEYDPEMLSMMFAAMLDAKRARTASVAPPMEPPASFARGGIAEAARLVASQGRYGDTMLAHITPAEARMLKRAGGSGTINPKTGLPEYWNPFSAVVDFISGAVSTVTSAIKSVVKGIGNAVKAVVASPVGKVVATIALTAALGPAGMGIANATWAPVLASMGTTAIGGGNIKDILTAGATSYFGSAASPVSQYVNGYTQQLVSNEVMRNMLNSTIVGTGINMLTGQKFEDAVKNGLTASVTEAGINYLGATTPKADVETGNMRSAAQVMDDGLATPPDRGVMRDAGQVMTEARGQFDLEPAMGPPAPAPSPSLSSGRGFDIEPAAVPPGGIADIAYQTADQVQGGLDADGTNIGLPQPKERYGTTDMRTPSQKAMDSLESGITSIGEGAQNLYQRGMKYGEEALDYLSPKGSRVKEANIDAVKTAKEVADKSGYTPGTPEYSTVFREAFDDAKPGIFTKYGPAVGAGLGVTALMGGFQQPTPPDDGMKDKLMGTPGQDLIEQDPGKYIVQGVPGFQYDEQGNMVGYAPPEQPTMEDVRVPSPYATSPESYNINTASGGGYDLQTPGMQQPMAPPTNWMQALEEERRRQMQGLGYMTAANGGIAALAQGGAPRHMSGYPRRTGQIAGPGTETSDSIPAMLSDGEFVMTARAVRGMGNGSRKDGAKKMYALMHQLERNAARA